MAEAALEEGIVEVRSVLTAHDGYLRGNETVTRALVIDRVLVALGYSFSGVIINKDTGESGQESGKPPEAPTLTTFPCTPLPGFSRSFSRIPR